MNRYVCVKVYKNVCVHTIPDKHVHIRYKATRRTTIYLSSRALGIPVAQLMSMETSAWGYGLPDASFLFLDRWDRSAG